MRREVVAAHPDLTLTGLYNLREQVMLNRPLTRLQEIAASGAASTS